MSDRYRRVSRAATGDRDVVGEHNAIVAAVLARDADQAVDLLDRHVRETDALVRRALLGSTGRRSRSPDDDAGLDEKSRSDREVPKKSHDG